MIEYDCQLLCLSVLLNLHFVLSLPITSIPVAEIVAVTLIPVVEVVALTIPAADVVTITSTKTNTRKNDFVN